MLIDILGFLLLINIIVFVHEYAHLIIARASGFHVKTFSLGFGKPFWKRADRHGTTFAVAPIPLGGYIQFDENELAFTRLNRLKLIGVSLAGPLGNFLFAGLILTAVFMLPYEAMKPTFFHTEESSPIKERFLCTKAGTYNQFVLEASNGYSDDNPTKIVHEEDFCQRDGFTIISVEGKSVSTMNEALREIEQYIESSALSLEPYISITMTSIKDNVPDPNDEIYSVQIAEPDSAIQGNLGIYPPLLPIITSLDPESEAAGKLMIGDEILALNDAPVTSGETLMDALRNFPGQIVKLRVQRGEETLNLNIAPGSRSKFTGDLGIDLTNLAIWNLEYTQQITEEKLNKSLDHMTKSTVLVEAVDSKGASADILQPGDEILRLNGTSLKNRNDLLIQVARSLDASIDLDILRNNEPLQLQLTPAIQSNTHGYLGVSFKPNPEYIFVVKPSIVMAFNRSISLIGNVLQANIDLLLKGTLFKHASGPLGIANFTSQALSSEAPIRSFFILMSLLSIALGFFNLFPLPVLDGGKALIFGLEAIFKKPAPHSWINTINFISFMLLIALIVYVTVEDLRRLLF